MHVHTIIGPTGIGKSARAVTEARRLDAPIVVADRIQCYVDLTTTSARHTGQEDDDLRRHFLDTRTVDDGDYSPDAAHVALRRTLHELSREHRCVVVEGGSISLLSAFLGASDDLPFEVSTELMRVTDPYDHMHRLRLRARRMLAPPEGQPGLLQELAAAWRYKARQEFVASIVGLGTVIRWCGRHEIPIESLSEFSPSPSQTDELAAVIAYEHAAYGELQHQAFLAMPRRQLRRPQTVGHQCETTGWS
ncbi:isopentenyl transferase [Nocardia sp. BSTN01]|uniref:isopentenyl transferase family protein n=1 Tax=Nocardia sp. BSTN01 TaxID=2783665 RepID=UPI0018901977|nr:isopentenyl transferase family protein [Nocardia sp. BSTN01]MBF5000389.1 isopentenyl transferase [Nocardia sp. BSTN01]